MENSFMELAFSASEQGLGSVKTNPCVGAVIVYNKKIIGVGYHTAYGKPHAEVEAFNSVKEENLQLIQHATLYCTLEPCFHYSKTPPCVLRVLKEKIKHVVIAYIDPNPEVSGKSVELMRSEGVKVEILSETMPHYFEAAFSKTLLPFFTNQKFKRPYVILKWAQSKDGFIAKQNERTAISNELTRYEVHKWRSQVDAIMVGSNTVVVDNPELTNRLFTGNSPIRITFKSANEKAPDAKLFTDDLETWLIDDNLEMTSILSEMYQKKIGTLLVEGGAYLLNSFIKNNLFDEIRVITSPKYLFDGVKAPKLNTDCVLTRTDSFTGDTIEYFYKS